MSQYNESEISPRWASFKKMWLIVAVILFLLLLILWILGYGPNGNKCQTEPQVATKEVEVEKVVEAGKIVEVEKIVTAPDTIAPSIKLATPTVHLLAGTTIENNSVIAVDNIDGDVDVKITGNVDSNTPGKYVLTYTATDAAGNTSTKLQEIFVEAAPDSEAPSLVLNGSPEVTLVLGSTYTDAGAIATDNTDKSLKIITTGKVDTNAVGEYLLRYEVTDKAGNTASKSRVVIVKAAPDTEAPKLTLNGSAVEKVAIGSIYLDAGATVTDNADKNIEIIVLGKVDTKALGEYLLNYEAADSAGNVALPISRKVIVESLLDTEAPKLTLNGSPTESITLGSNYSDPGATVSDNTDSDIEITVTGTVDTNTPGKYTLEYKATDSAGNTATQLRSILVEAAPDTEPPRLYLKGLSVTKVTVGTTYSDIGVTTIDNSGKSVEVKVSGGVDTNTVGEYVLEYTATDAAGNTSKLSRKVIVEAEIEPDSEPPVLVINGNSIEQIQLGETYEDLGAVATDNIDTNISILVEGQVDTNEVGEYILTYIATDAAGNTTSDNRMVIVEAAKKAMLLPPVAKLYFENNSSNFPADTELSLAGITSYLHNNSQSQVVISGFHSSSGQLAYNQKLSRERANSVKELLIDSGIIEDRIIMKKPLRTRGSGSPREARRVEVKIANP